MACSAPTGALMGRWVVTVDPDVDYTDLAEVVWAILTRADVATAYQLLADLWTSQLDPVAVAKESIDYARRHMRDIVIVDTAGRLGIDADMMAQAASIRDAVQPDEIVFVIDAMVGQDAVATAEAFRDGVGITGVVLSKLDGDARGGAALSVRHVTGEPILFASTGEKLEDFDVFHPDRMASRILGMGDVLTLIEQAEQAFDEDQKEKMADAQMLAGVRGDGLCAQVNVGEAERGQVGAGVAAHKLGLDFVCIWQSDGDLVLPLDDMVGSEDNGCGVGAPDDASGRLAGPGCDGDNRTRRVLDDACQLI